MRDLEIISNANNLYNAFYDSTKDTRWKEEVQKYEIDLLQNIYKSKTKILDGTYKPLPLLEFKLSERGRVRWIKAQHISDRVIQRSLDDNVLIPRIRPKLIYDNCASLEGRGERLQRKRFEIHMREAYKELGENAYVLFLDFRKYFDNIKHRTMLEQLSRFVDDELLNFISETVFKPFEIDVSYMSDEEYAECMEVVFNAVEYAERGYPRAGEKMMKKSLGIGNPTSQICGVLYPHPVDNLCKIVLGCKQYGRYQDDTYIMGTKEELLKVLEKVTEKCEECGLIINKKKTRLNKVTKWSTYLKINYKMVEGRLIRKIGSEALRRERQKLRAYKRLLDKKRMSAKDVEHAYKAWRGSYKKYDSGYEILKMDRYYTTEVENAGRKGNTLNENFQSKDKSYKRCKRNRGLESSKML